MAKFSSKGLLGIAGILSFIVALLVYSYLSSVEPMSKADATVILAKMEILPNTIITAEMIEQVKIPASYQQPSAVTSMNRVVGIAAKEHIMNKEQITERLLMVEGRATGFTGIIPKDKRALSISVNDISGVAGLIKPGDWVDVIVAVDSSHAEAVANMPLQNILVLAANKNSNAGEQESITKEDKVITITLAVTPDEATLLALAQVKGSIFLSLRPYPLPANSLALVEAKTLNSLRGDSPSSYTPVAVHTSASAPAPESSPSLDDKARNNNMKFVSVVRGTKSQDIPVK